MQSLWLSLACRLGSIALLTAALCAPAAAVQFAFAAFGDVPYNAAEEAELPGLIREMNREALSFVIHVGDFKSSGAECSDALFAKRRDQFSRSRHPFIYIPGDNEWTDCARYRRKPYDPVERLRKLREIFFASDATLGERSLKVQRQSSAGYPEHLRWIADDVLFATFNVPGPDNNADKPEESQPRTRAVLDWMREAFSIANRRKLPGLVLAMQADLWAGAGGRDEIISTLASEAERYAGEVLLVHGDTHWFRFDRPLIDPRTGKRVNNVTRLEVWGSPFVSWIRVSVRTENGRAYFEAAPWSNGGKSAQPASADR